MIAVKAHKARCLKILTVAKKAIEEETDRMVKVLAEIDFGPKQVQTPGRANSTRTEAIAIDNSPGNPFTPPPPTTGKNILKRSVTPNKIDAYTPSHRCLYFMQGFHWRGLRTLICV
jgi:hypothetical protein